MQLLQSNHFQKQVKKLPAQHKAILDNAVRDIMQNPSIGEVKVGDLRGVLVYKFPLQNQKMLLAYAYHDPIITLLSFGPHENFYRDLKRVS